MFEKIEKAKKGYPVTIYPADLQDGEWDDPLTLADIIAMGQAFGMPYTVNVSPPSFTITPTAPVYETFLRETDIIITN